MAMSEERVWVLDFGTKPREIVVAKWTSQFVYEAGGLGYKGKPRFNRWPRSHVFASKREVLAHIVEIAEARVDQRKEALAQAEGYLARCIERRDAEPES